MADPISMNDALVYAALGDRPKGAPDYIGVFIQNGRPLPVMFEGDQASIVFATMDAWLHAEREKAAKRESHLAYLRSEEAIAARKAAREARKLAKANGAA